MRTKIGFTGSEDPLLAPGPVRPSPTVLGRAAPNPLPPGATPPRLPPDLAAPSPRRPASPAPPQAVAGGSSGKSNFPARAGFWGRRDSQGDLVPLTDPGLVGLRDEHRVVRRQHRLQNGAVVLGSAALAFALVFLLIERPRMPATQTPPPVMAAPSLSPPPVPASITPTSVAPPLATPPRIARETAAGRATKASKPKRARRASPPPAEDEILLPR